MDDAPQQAYPLPVPMRGGDDPRFSVGLAYDVAQVLVAHGYPPIHGRDMVDLQQALYRFLYVGRGE